MEARGCFRPRCCLGLERENPFRTAGKTDKPLRVLAFWTANETKKARSVVALSRVPRRARGAPVSPPAADHVVKLSKERYAESINSFIHFAELADRSRQGGDFFFEKQVFRQGAKLQGFLFQFSSPPRPVCAEVSRHRP